MPQPQVVLQEILAWTAGQPFLTQKLCQLVLRESGSVGGEEIDETLPIHWVEHLVCTYIVNNWESQDEPEHLRTIRDRLLRYEQRAGRLLEIYQHILQVLERHSLLQIGDSMPYSQPLELLNLS
jgi:hypothetical protein